MYFMYNSEAGKILSQYGLPPRPAWDGAAAASPPCNNTLLVGLANTFEADGYLPTAAAVDEGDYEVCASRYAPAAAAALAQASVDNIKDCLNANKGQTQNA